MACRPPESIEPGTLNVWRGGGSILGEAAMRAAPRVGPMEQHLLVVRAAAGDQDAFASLAAGHIDRCYALAYRILRDPDRAQDASQQALIGAWREDRKSVV